MRTPDEIKRGLDFCSTEPYPKACFVGCVYEGEGMTCIPALMTDALSYIRELEAELEAAKECENGLSIMLTSAQSDADRFKRERDELLGKWEGEC